ncbi:hypothetical protein CCHL11_06740 [Colletotrichum chlorophyti]|uniref:Uncharacterized protein n=1 Tax=Colletotrichum chlorophyti TaxID=708187 RepID=A0A1Q8RZ29_9PEZI|nr:hypothetical protein CCHL11_06740 [Colletotrichum chlorophyti]
MRSLASMGTTANCTAPSTCSNLSTVASQSSSTSSPSQKPRHDLTTSTPPQPLAPQSTPKHHQHHQKPVQQKNRPPDSSRPKRNIRPSITPATRNNPATTSTAASSSSSSFSSPAPSSSSSHGRPPNSSSSPSPSAAVTANRKPTVAQCRGTHSHPTATTTTPAAPKPTGPPTTTGPRRSTPNTRTPTPTPTPVRSSVTTTAPTATSTTTTASANTTKTTTLSSNQNTTSSSPLPSPRTTTSFASPAPTPTPASSRRQHPTLPSSSRTPLRNRDQNVLSPSHPTDSARVKPSPTPSPTSSSAFPSTSSTPTMPPYEKGGSTTTRQPPLPSLGPKAIGRAPLTPKVAAKPTPVVPPLGRRRNDNSNNSNHHQAQHATAGLARDDLTSPAPFLATTNITPRSGSRQSRVNSANTTPNGTPNGTPNPERDADWERKPTHLADPPRRQVVTFSPPSTVSSRHDATESKFFYASEAQNAQVASQPKAQLKSQPKPMAAASQRNSTFMYANGNAVEKNRPTSPGLGFTPVLAPSLAPSLSPSLAPTPEPQSSKFFYANGAPDLQPGFRPSSAASAAGSVTSTSGKLPRTSAGSAGGFPMAQRPLSPNRPVPLTAAPMLKNSNNLPPHAVARAQMTSPPPLAPPPHKRRTSTDTHSQVASHVGSENPPTDAMIMSRFMNSQSSTPSEMPSPTIPSFFPNQPVTIASIIQAAEDLDEEAEEDEGDEVQGSGDESKDLDGLHSPTKSTHGDPLNDMVVNARRERKVQDLEITNASLEAINRSLERQLRKQTAEIRRYKRLSRSGRLSVPSGASSLAPSRNPSDGAAGGLGIEGLDLSDLSEEEDAGNDFEDLDDSMFESSELSETDSTSAASPNPDVDRHTRRRTRDEKRLRLDLTKHRELLVDSQKINQSIKRCLNWTEELIKEGKKALEYSVRPSDVEMPLPPRVLHPQYEDDNDNGDEVQEPIGDISVPSSPLESPRSLTVQWSKEPQDRDSGIELPADGG